MTLVSFELTLGDGSPLRFGHDEADPQNVPSNISWATSQPGGFGTCQVTVPKPANLRADDQLLFSPTRLLGRGGRVFHEGYVVGISQASAHEITFEIAGWSTVLERIQTFREIFVDRDISRWMEASRAGRMGLLTIFNSVQSFSQEPDSTLPALTLTVPATEINPVCDAWYDAGPGVKVASIYYDMTSLSLSAYYGAIGVADDDTGSNSTDTGDLLTGTNTAAAGTYTPSTPRRWAWARFYLVGTVGSKDQSMSIRRPAVYGAHGLTKRGTAPEGFWASDVIRYVLSRVPGLSVGVIEPTSFVIPHLVFAEDTTIQSVIEQLTALGGNQNVPNDWGVYENREFFWRSPGTYGREWHVRKGGNAEPVSDGPDADRRIAGIKINYTNEAGNPRSVGPPGSNSDYETTDLLDTDRTNPAHKIPGVHTETMGITSQQGAVNAGILLLNDRNRLDWRGSITVTGTVEDPQGNPYPVAMMRAGDRIVVEDENGDQSEPRTIVTTDYTHDGQRNTCSIGAKPDSFETLLGQLAAVTDLIPE